MHDNEVYINDFFSLIFPIFNYFGSNKAINKKIIESKKFQIILGSAESGTKKKFD